MCMCGRACKCTYHDYAYAFVDDYMYTYACMWTAYVCVYVYVHVSVHVHVALYHCTVYDNAAVRPWGGAGVVGGRCALSPPTFAANCQSDRKCNEQSAWAPYGLFANVWEWAWEWMSQLTIGTSFTRSAACPKAMKDSRWASKSAIRPPGHWLPGQPSWHGICALECPLHLWVGCRQNLASYRKNALDLHPIRSLETYWSPPEHCSDPLFQPTVTYIYIYIHTYIYI